MSRADRWQAATRVLKPFVVFLLALGLIFVALTLYDRLGSHSISSFLDAHGPPRATEVASALYFAVSILLYVFGIPTLLWHRWRGRMRFVGTAGQLDLGIVFPRRGMSLQYVPLRRKVAMTPDTTTNGADSSEDAEAYLLVRANDGVLGFLLSGAALVGKTRFASEWLRKHRPASLLLIARAETPLRPQPRLRRFRKQGVCLFLDDLDRFASVAESVDAFIDMLSRWHVPLLVAATVRNGGPARLVDGDPAFARLRARLDRFSFLAPEQEQLLLTSTILRRPLNQLPDFLAKSGESSFAWLLETQFDEMRRRYGALQQDPRQLLAAARLLDNLEIPVTSQRWLVVARELFGVADAAQSVALSTLRGQGFVSESTPDAVWLTHVVERPASHETSEALADCLTLAGDASGLLYWGEALADSGDDEAAERRLRAAAAAASGGWADALETAARASLDLGVLLDRRDGETERSAEALRDAITLGKAAGTEEGREIAAAAGSRLPAAVTSATSPIETTSGYDEVLEEFSDASGPRQRELLAATLMDKAGGLETMGRAEEALGVYDQLFIRLSTAPEPKVRELVARALLNKGIRLGKLGRSPDALVTYDLLVMTFGDAQEERVREILSMALVNRSARLVALGRGEDAIRTCDEVLQRFGDAPEPALREGVARALLNKGAVLGMLGRREEEIAAYREVLRLFGQASEQPLRELVAKAIANRIKAQTAMSEASAGEPAGNA